MAAFRDFIEREIAGYIPQMIQHSLKFDFDIQKQLMPRLPSSGTSIGRIYAANKMLTPARPARIHHQTKPMTPKSKLKTS